MGLMKLFGLPATSNTARVIACLEEVGAEYEVVLVDSFAGEHKQPPHLLRNPFGLLPALQDDDIMLFESRAISRYVVRKYNLITGGPDLLRESNPKESAMVDVWTEVEAQHYDPAIAPIIFEGLVVPYCGGEPSKELIASSMEKLKEVLHVYEARLSESKYLAGDFFSLADLLHLPYTHYLMHMPPYGSIFDSFPRVMAWWEDMSSRPACKKTTDMMPIPPAN